MKRFAGLLVVLLGSAVLLLGQNSSVSTETTGVICNSKCVTQQAGHASCDQNCSAKDGETVFITQEGNVTGIANPDATEGKKAKAGVTKEVKDKNTSDQDFEEFDRMVRYLGGGG